VGFYFIKEKKSRIRFQTKNDKFTFVYLIRKDIIKSKYIVKGLSKESSGGGDWGHNILSRACVRASLTRSPLFFYCDSLHFSLLHFSV